jgi:hypothetical protein
MIDFNEIFSRDARQVQIEAVHVGRRYRPVRDIQSLQASIAELGLLQPVVIHPGGFLIAGARRVAACQALGWDEIPARVIDLDQVIRGERDKNVVREPFTPSEMVAIGGAIEELERAAAKQRMSEGARVGQISTPSGRTRDKVAAAVGVSGRTYEKRRPRRPRPSQRSIASSLRPWTAPGASRMRFADSRRQSRARQSERSRHHYRTADPIASSSLIRLGNTNCVTKTHRIGQLCELSVDVHC